MVEIFCWDFFVHKTIKKDVGADVDLFFSFGCLFFLILDGSHVYRKQSVQGLESLEFEFGFPSNKKHGLFNHPTTLNFLAENRGVL